MDGLTVEPQMLCDNFEVASTTRLAYLDQGASQLRCCPVQR